MLARRGLLRNADPHVQGGNVSDPGARWLPISSKWTGVTGFAMTVNLTRIYTKLGDDGETHLGDMSRVSKLHPRVEAYGTVDELNATIGVALLAPDMPGTFAEWLRRVQNDLLDVGADLSVPPPSDEAGAKRERPRLRVDATYTEWLEGACDEVNAKLEPLRSFVIPGGTPAASHLHMCRTVCRRAERRALAVGEGCNPEVVRYLNRLSDLLFILSRAANVERADGAEPLWEPGSHHSSSG
jgi:cob(I)alamin adenosyltransferase